VTRSILTIAVLAASLGTPPALVHAADKPRHDLTVAAKEIGGPKTNRFKMYGAVPTAAGVELRVQRKVDKGAFADWATETTAEGTGRFSFRIYGGKRGSTVCYRVVVPSDPVHRTTKGKKWCIRTAAS
jgi:hypothetical protein